MAGVRSGMGAALWLFDGSGTPEEMEVAPMEANVSFSVEKNVVEFLHRGQKIANGEGVLPAQQQPLQLPFTVALKDLTDAVNIHTLLMWMMGKDSVATAITGAGWTSTTTAGADGYRTLDARYYPGGKASGRANYRFPNMRIVGWEVGEELEGATLISITLQSVDAYEPVFTPGS